MFYRWPPDVNSLSPAELAFFQKVGNFPCVEFLLILMSELSATDIMQPATHRDDVDDDGYSSDHFRDEFWRTVFDGYEDKRTQQYATRRRRDVSLVL